MDEADGEPSEFALAGAAHILLQLLEFAQDGAAALQHQRAGGRQFHLQDLIKGYELVEALDGMAGYLLAERVAAGDVDGQELEALLTPLVDRMEENLDRDQARIWAELDGQFHQIIFDMSENALIASSYYSVRDQMKSVLSFVSPIYVDRANSVREHRLIIAAIAAGDSEKARKLCQDHRHLVREILKKLLLQI